MPRYCALISCVLPGLIPVRIAEPGFDAKPRGREGSLIRTGRPSWPSVGAIGITPASCTAAASASFCAPSPIAKAGTQCAEIARAVSRFIWLLPSRLGEARRRSTPLPLSDVFAAGCIPVPAEHAGACRSRIRWSAKARLKRPLPLHRRKFTHWPSRDLWAC